MLSSAPREVRVNNRTPRPRSSAAMRLETACWVTASSSAASWNRPASAAATKVRTLSRSMATTLRPQPLVVVGRSRGCLIPACGARFDVPDRGTVVRGSGGDGGMNGGHRLGRRFGWFWGAYGTSALGTWLAFGAFPLIAIRVLHAGPAEVAALSSVGAAVGAAVAVPLGPWVEFRRKRQVLIATDLVRCAALLTVPTAYAFGVLTLVQLLLVSAAVAAADITFRAASGAYLKTLLPAEDLLVANARLESTSWTLTIVGPPLGGAAIGLLGPVATVVADAVSHLLSALGIRATGGDEPRPERRKAAPPRAGDLLDGWRYILADRTLRPLFFNTVLFNGLVMAAQPLLAVLMLGRLGFAPWQYGLAFAAPSVGGLLGSRLARPLADRFGQHRVLVAAG
ncbi:transmembrane efflux protein, partial [Streptomyces griseoflavus Tu4000]